MKNDKSRFNAYGSMYENKSRWMWNGDQHAANAITTTTGK